MLPELLLATVPLLPLFNFKKRKVGGIWFF